MKYTLMNKNTPIYEIDMSESGVIRDITKIYNLNFQPPGISDKNIEIIVSDLQNWWHNRGIPANRDGIKELYQNIANLDNIDYLKRKSFGLSLSDQYWIRPDEQLQWKDINFFEHDFSEDIGELLCDHKQSSQEISLMSPDNTSDGWLKKKWKIEFGDRVLLKSGSRPFIQEPVNEIIASSLYEKILPNDSFVHYDMTVQNDIIYSKCKNFITMNTELVPAERIRNKNIKNTFDNFLQAVKDVGLDPNQIRTEIEKMLMCDYLLANTDRHYNNFGFIRDVNTLQYTGMAPIFDSGTSLFCNQTKEEIEEKKISESKPFLSKHAEQIKLVQAASLKELDLQQIQDLPDIVHEKLMNNLKYGRDRIGIICERVKDNLLELEKIRSKEIQQYRMGMTLEEVIAEAQPVRHECRKIIDEDRER